MYLILYVRFRGKLEPACPGKTARSAMGQMNDALMPTSRRFKIYVYIYRLFRSLCDELCIQDDYRADSENLRLGALEAFFLRD
jgi:hypothetical protein